MTGRQCPGTAVVQTVNWQQGVSPVADSGVGPCRATTSGDAVEDAVCGGRGLRKSGK